MGRGRRRRPQQRTAIGSARRAAHPLRDSYIYRPDSFQLRDGLLRELAGRPAKLLQSIIWDQGSGMAAISTSLLLSGRRCTSATPVVPWRRDSDESTNKTLPQYFPKSIDLSRYTRVDLLRVELQLDHGP